MKQYCRYCSHCFIRDSELYHCEEKMKWLNQKQIVGLNKCKYFIFNPIAVDNHELEYRSREQLKKLKQVMPITGEQTNLLEDL